MNEFELTKPTFTRKMRAEAKSIMSWLRDDYKENHEKIGRMKAQGEFEEFFECESFIGKDGRKWYKAGVKDTSKPSTYECVLYIFVPLTGMSFKATDRHKYRWNEKWQRFEHEETEII